MNDNTKFKSWTEVINSVKTPLGFFALIALVVDGILAVAAAATDKVPILAPVILLGLLIICVSMIVFYRPGALGVQMKPMRVNLIFKDKANNEVPSNQVDIDVEKCILEICEWNGNHKYEGHTNLTGKSNWTFQLPEDVDSSDYVRLHLTEYNGRKWRINSFAPYVNTQIAEEER